MVVLGKPFQPSLIFASKVGAYQSEVPFRHSSVGALKYPQTLG
jgi:hypothetical protein